MPRTANIHSRSWISAYSSPPTKTRASRGQQQRRRARRPRPRPSTSARLRISARRRSCGGRHRREGDDHHELRQEQHRLGEDQAAGVEAGVVLVEHVAGDDDVGVRAARRRPAAPGSCAAISRMIGRCAWCVAEPCAGRSRSGAARSQPTSDRRRRAPRATPSMAVELGRVATGSARCRRRAGGRRWRGRSPATGPQRRSPCRMPSWPPMIVSGTAASATRTPAARLSSCSSRSMTRGQRAAARRRPGPRRA